MQTYLVRRPGIAGSANELDAALTRLRAFEETPAALLAQWRHSYALREPDGRFGLVCVFQAHGPDTLRRHAEQTGLPATEILPLSRTLLGRAFAPALVHLVRRRRAWPDQAELEAALLAARRIGDQEMARQVSWLHSYAVHEDDGSLGSLCLYQGVDAAALRLHAQRAGLPADEVTPVLGRIVFHEGSASDRMASLSR